MNALPSFSLSALAVGHVTHDFYDDLIVPGGCAFFGAKTMAGLGARTGLVTAYGAAFQCAEQLGDLTVRAAIGEHTTAFCNLYPEGGMRRQLVQSQADRIEPSSIGEGLLPADLVLIAPVMEEIDARAWTAVRGRRLTALCLQGFLKTGQPGATGRRTVVANGRPFDEAIVDGIDAVFLSEEDIALFGPPGLLETLRARVPHVAVTRGADGCTLFQGDRSDRVGVYATEAVDPTGAGDTFAGATALGLASGLSFVRAAALGAAAASIVVEAIGGSALPRIREAFTRWDAVPIAAPAPL